MTPQEHLKTSQEQLKKKLNPPQLQPKPQYRMLIAPPNSPQPRQLHSHSMDIESTLDLSALRDALPKSTKSTKSVPLVQPLLYCAPCNQRYEPVWYDTTHRRCFFCMRFRSPNITRYALLYETQWYFIQSGESDPYEYYITYFALLHRWADQKQIPFTQKEADYQDYLWLTIRDE